MNRNPVRWTRSFSICTLAVVLGACTTTRKQTAEYVREGVGSVNEITDAIYESALANRNTDPELLRPAHERFKNARALQEARLDSLVKRLDEQEQALRSMLQSLVSVAGIAVPGNLGSWGEAFSKVASLLTGFRDTGDRNKETVGRVDTRLAELDATNTQKLEDLRARNDALEREARENRSRFDQELQRIADRHGITTEQLDEARKQLAALSESTRTKLEELSAENVRQLANLDSKEVLLNSLQERAKLTDEERKELEGFSMAEILALILAGGAGVGASRLGKPRNNVVVEDHGKQLEDLWKSVDRSLLALAKLEAGDKGGPNPSGG